MTVPSKVPPDVPAGAATEASRKRTRTSRKSNGGNTHHVTREGDGWRFQRRVPATLAGDFRLAGVAPIVRASLGPRGRGEARLAMRRDLRVRVRAAPFGWNGVEECKALAAMKRRKRDGPGKKAARSGGSMKEE